MHCKNLILGICALLLISACVAKNSTVKTDATKAPPPSSTSISATVAKMLPEKHERLIELLSFIESYSNLAPDAQKKVFAATNQALADSKSNLMQRAKTAIMLALPTSRLRDPAKAQALLQDLLRDDSLDSQENALLGLLYEYAQDDSKQSQKSRDDAKRIETLQQKYETLQQKHEALEQKLNELKNIEKTMNERSTKTDSKP